MSIERCYLFEWSLEKRVRKEKLSELLKDQKVSHGVRSDQSKAESHQDVSKDSNRLKINALTKRIL